MVSFKKLSQYTKMSPVKALLVFALTLGLLLPAMQKLVHATDTIEYLHVNGTSHNIGLMAEDTLTGPGWKYVKSTNILTLDGFTSTKRFGCGGSKKADLQVHLKGNNILNLDPGEKAIINGTSGGGGLKITAEPGATLTINTQLDGSKAKELIDVGDYSQLGGTIDIRHTLPSTGIKNPISFIYLTGFGRKLELRNNSTLSIHAQTDGQKDLSAINLRSDGRAELRTSDRLNIIIDKPNWLSTLPSSPSAANAIYGHGSQHTIIGGSGTSFFQTVTSQAITGKVSLEDGQKLVEPNQPDFVSGKLNSERKLRFTIPSYYRINLNCDSNGNCSKNPSKDKYLANSNVTVTVTANTGYVIDSYKINGITESGTTGVDTHEKHLLMDGDKTINITFKKESYNLSLAVSDSNGTVTPSSSYPEYQEEVVFIVNPNPGYRLKKLTYQPVGDPEQDITSTLRFNMPAKNTMYSYEFEPDLIEYTITIDPSITHGTVTANLSNASSGTEIQLAINPDPGYRLKSGSLKLNNDPIVGNKFSMPDQDAFISAEFELIPPTTYTVTATNGTATPASATAGTTVNLVADSAPAGQIFDKWTTTTPGITFTDANSPNTSFTMPSSNVQVTATYKAKPTNVNLTINCGDQGFCPVTPSGTSFPSGTVVRLDIGPNEGYIIDKLIINGTVVPGASDKGSYSHNITLTADTTAVISFKKGTFHIASTGAFTHGTVVPSLSTAEFQQEVSFIVTPDSGYRLKKLTYVRSGTSGSPVDITNAKKLAMPPYDITFTAEFELIPPTTYTVTATNGTATPASATAGTTVNLVANSAPAGQIFDKWTTTTPGITFTDANSPNTSFTMPSSNVQVTATYKVKPGSETPGSSSISNTPNTSNTSNISPRPGISETIDNNISKPSLKLEHKINKTSLSQNESFTLKLKNLGVSTSSTVGVWINSIKLGDINISKDWQSKDFIVSCQIPTGKQLVKIKHNETILLEIPLIINSNSNCLNASNGSKTDNNDSNQNIILIALSALAMTVLASFGVYALTKRSRR